MQPFVFTLFGITGDLSRRKLLPTLYTLFLNKKFPEGSHILGYGRKVFGTTENGDDEFRLFVLEDLVQTPGYTPNSLDAFFTHLTYKTIDFANQADFDAMKEDFATLDQQAPEPLTRLFYLALPPQQYASVSQHLAAAGLIGHDQNARLMIEKPFGHDTASAQALSEELHHYLSEDQIFRIDHFLGKLLVRTIPQFRQNHRELAEHWSKDFISGITVTVSETLGIGTRGGYYDTAGAIRDMVQNHCLELLALTIMAPPTDNNSLRRARTHAIEQLHTLNWTLGQHEGYHQEDKIAPDSTTETFAVVTFESHDPNWLGVPFTILTGKLLAEKRTQIAVTFREPVTNDRIEEVILEVQPDNQVKAVTTGDAPRTLVFSDEFSNTSASETDYGTLFLDAINGDQTYFVHQDEVMAGWRVVAPILEHKKTNKPVTYKPGSQGPTR